MRGFTDKQQEVHDKLIERILESCSALSSTKSMSSQVAIGDYVGFMQGMIANAQYRQIIAKAEETESIVGGA